MSGMRLVAYLRVSYGSQLDGFGLDVQERAVRSWTRAHSHHLVDIHTDAGVSGATDAADAADRPGLSAALLALQQPPQAEGLIVARLDRLARALTVQEAALAIVWQAGGRVFTADAGEVRHDDPDDPMRTAMRHVVRVFAQLDRRMVVKHMRDAAPRDDAQQAVSRILELRRAGKSYRVIAATLDAEGLRPRRAERWSAMTVRKMAVREWTLASTLEGEPHVIATKPTDIPP